MPAAWTASLLLAAAAAAVLAAAAAADAPERGSSAGAGASGTTDHRWLSLIAGEHTPTYTTGAGGASATTTRRVRSAPADRWLSLIAEYARAATGTGTVAGGRRGAGQEEEEGDWFPRPVPLTLPFGRGGGAVPVLVLPLPLPAALPAASDTERKHATQCYTAEGGASAPAPTGPERVPESPYRRPLADRIPQPRLEPALPQPTELTLPAAAQSDGARLQEEPAVPHLDYVVSSQQLVELFQAQRAPQPELPPVVFPEYSGAAPSEPEQGAVARAAGRLVRLRRYQLQPAERARAGPPPPPPARAQEGAPPAPRIARSLVLRGELTVPRAGYSEPYTVWWDAASGAARVDLHAGATSTYRALLPDGRVRHVEMRLDRSGAQERRRCAEGAPRPPTAEDRALPAVPDLHAFSFTGYVDSEYGRVERWAHAVSGGAGELGGARGEALSFRHELLLARASDDLTVTPLKYSVQVDSSVLGERADGYVHRYTELRDQQHEPGFFVLDLVESCDEVSSGSPAPARARLEPLREFTLSYRDPAHSAAYDRFKSEHARRYWDETEEAVRKNLLMQHTRFVSSGNRQGATFAMEMNHLGDRLDAELGVLRGVREERSAGDAGERFPHARDQVEAARARLPRQFDWRQHGAVTHVRNQGSCSSCWAFAVTGAVEGALWLRTRALVPLSEQVLVDCAGPFGGHGCGGTWPSAAYDYVRSRGQPALADYPPYKAKVEACAADTAPPVTHISGHVNVTRNNVDALKVAIRRHAPTVVIIDSTPKSFVFYKKGVIHDERCAKNKAEHAVLAVGWGVRRGGEEHIIVKNSWSEAWGEAGYARLQARANTCGVLSRPSYPRLERPDVDRLPPSSPAA